MVKKVKFQLSNLKKNKKTWAHKNGKLSPQTKLLRHIYQLYGGVAATAKILGKSKALLHYWSIKGHVPLVHVNWVSETLRVSPYALNFEEYSRFTGVYKPWSEVVKEVNA